MRIFAVLLLFISLSAQAITVTMRETKTKKVIGEIELIETKYGVLIKPALKNVSPGVHGFHLHTYPRCDKGGSAAGGHYDPSDTKRHLGPYYEGHLGDLPALTAAINGDVVLPVLAPRIKLKDLHDHALILHQGGDNYADLPEPLGGGGARMACGLIKPAVDPQLQKVLKHYKHAPVKQN